MHTSGEVFKGDDEPHRYCFPIQIVLQILLDTMVADVVEMGDRWILSTTKQLDSNWYRSCRKYSCSRLFVAVGTMVQNLATERVNAADMMRMRADM